MTSQWPAIYDRCSAFRRGALRSAFTLVELLVVMTVLGILASMVLFALASATESARVAKLVRTAGIRPE